MIGRLRSTVGGASERGQVLVVSLGAMIVLLVMLGLAIDGGRGYWERRQAQNAAEHAALAAAWEVCENPSAPDPAGKARLAATDNGFTDDGTTTWVTPTATNPSTGEWEVVVRRELRTTFAALIGFETIGAAGRAVADCQSTSGEGFAIFAGGTTCDDTGKWLVEIAGSTNTITGAVHSNVNLKVGGSDNVFDGSVTYVTIEDHHVSSQFPPDNPDQTGNQGWPALTQVFTLDRYRTMAQASSTDDLFYFTTEVKSEDIDADGLYYSTEKIDIGDGHQDWDVTLVSEKGIIIGGSDNRYDPYIDNLLAFSGMDAAAGQSDLKKRCDEPGVKVSGDNNDWSGFLYAPESQIDMSGSNTSTLIGSMIGWSVKVSGSSVNNTADPSFFAGPPVLRLVE
jgi:hypothetical protein